MENNYSDFEYTPAATPVTNSEDIDVQVLTTGACVVSEIGSQYLEHFVEGISGLRQLQAYFEKNSQIARFDEGGVLEFPTCDLTIQNGYYKNSDGVIEGSDTDVVLTLTFGNSLTVEYASGLYDPDFDDPADEGKRWTITPEPAFEEMFYVFGGLNKPADGEDLPVMTLQEVQQILTNVVSMIVE